MSSTSSAVTDAGSAVNGAESSNSARQMSPGAIVGMVVGILGSLFLVGLIIFLAQWVKRRQRRRQAAGSNGNAQSQTTQVGSGTSLHQLVNGRLERVNSSSRNNNSDSNGDQTRGRRSRRPYRYNQRQDSGRSIRSVPAYNDEAGDDEVVLMKPRPSTDELSRMSTSEEAPHGAGSPDSVQPSVFEQNNYSTSSMPLVGQDANSEDPPLYVARTPETAHSLLPMVSRQSLSLTPCTTLGFDEMSIAESGESQHLRVSTEDNSSSSVGLLRLGHRATLSADNTSIRSMSFADQRNGSRFTLGKGPSARGNRARSHTTGSGMPLPRPFSFGRSEHTLSSRASTSSLVISAPIRETLVSSSDRYVYPKRGLSPAQMSFLASRESLALVGVRTTETEPPSFELTQSTSNLNNTSMQSLHVDANTSSSVRDPSAPISLPPEAQVEHDADSPGVEASGLSTPAIVVNTTSRQNSPLPSPSVVPGENPLEREQQPMSASSQRETLDDQILQQSTA